MDPHLQAYRWRLLQSQLQEQQFLSCCRTGSDHLSKLNGSYWHHYFEICGFFKLIVKKFTASHNYLTLQSFLVLGTFILPWKLKNHGFVVWVVNSIFIFDSQRIKSIFSLYSYFSILWNSRSFVNCSISLSSIATARKIEILKGFLFFNVHLDLLVISLAYPVRSKTNFYIYTAMCWYSTLSGNVWKSSSGVAVEDSFSYLLKVVGDLEVTYIFYFDSFLRVLIK